MTPSKPATITKENQRKSSTLWNNKVSSGANIARSNILLILEDLSFSELSMSHIFYYLSNIVYPIR